MPQLPEWDVKLMIPEGLHVSVARLDHSYPASLDAKNVAEYILLDRHGLAPSSQKARISYLVGVTYVIVTPSIGEEFVYVIRRKD